VAGELVRLAACDQSAIASTENSATAAIAAIQSPSFQLAISFMRTLSGGLFVVRAEPSRKRGLVKQLLQLRLVPGLGDGLV